MTVLVVGAVLVGTAGRAAAVTHWSYLDEMETTGDYWLAQFYGVDNCPKYHSCNQTAVTDILPQYAYSGTHYAWITVSAYPGGWSGIGRNIRLPLGATLCSMHVNIRGLSYGEDPTKVRVEVIKSDTWTYESKKTVYLTEPQSSTYQTISVPDWVPNSRQVYVRVVNFAQDFTTVIAADDMYIACQIG